MAFMVKQLHEGKFLVVDDFQGMRALLKDFVRAMGVANVDTATNGRDAMRALSAKRYDVIICDFNLGSGQNGQQVMEEAKLRDFIGLSTIWIMVTAEKTAEMVIGAAEVKPDDYILKPLNQALLQSRVEKLMQKKQLLGGIELAIKEHDYQRAIAECDVLLQSQPGGSQDILRIKADLLINTGDYEGAKALFESVLAARSVPWATTGLGKIRFHAGEWASAKALFEQVLRDNRMYMEASDWLVKTLAAMGNLKQAQEVLMSAVKLSPNSPQRQKSLGETAYKNGSLDIARTAFEQTIKISEFSPHKSPAAFTGLAKVFSDQGAPNDALKVLAKSRGEFKDNPLASMQAAAAESLVYKKMGDQEKSDAALNAAEQLLEELQGKVNPEVAMDMAKTLFAAGKKDKACGMLRDLIKNNHESAAISSQIEEVFKSENLLGEGQAIINEARQEVININNRGVLLAKSGEFQEGVKLLRTALKDMPHSEVVIMNLCGLLFGLMRKEGKSEALMQEVTELLERARHINPGSKKYQAYTAALNQI
jgi:tetratricopeptide (TPR) repeat protein